MALGFSKQPKKVVNKSEEDFFLKEAEEKQQLKYIRTYTCIFK